MHPLRILVVATKAPWPPLDGGRLVLLDTMRALTAAGHRLELVAPCATDVDEVSRALGEVCTPHLVPVRPRSTVAAASLGLARGVPTTVARHTLPAVRRKVDDLLDRGGFDVVHAEQLHSLPQTLGAHRLGIPVVHRAHNVESILWAFAARHRGPFLRPVTALEARRMSLREAAALESTACTIALTEPDRRALAELVPGATIHTVPAPFAARLPTGDAALDGEPAVVTLASADWAPSRDAVSHLVGVVWPEVRRRLPRAVLHVFGGDLRSGAFDGVTVHPAPDDSRTAFPAGSVVLVPERHPTGVPMKALEAWSRGLPLLVDPPTAEVLGATDGVELLIVRDGAGTAEALAGLSDGDLRRRLVEGGRRALTDRHDPSAVAAHLTRIYRWAIDR